MRPRALLGITAALLAAVLLGGCAGFGGTASDAGGPRRATPAETVQASFDKLKASGTAHAQSQSRSQVGQIDFTVNGDGVADLRQPAYDLNLTVPGFGTARTIGVVDVAYVQSQQLSAFLPGHPTWLLLDPRKLDAPGASTPGIDNPFVRFARETGDALPQLTLVKGANSQTRVVGQEPVLGQPATHYATQLDVDQARRYTTDPKALADLARYTQTVRARTLPADAWIDDQGRLLQLRIVFSTVYRDRGTDSTLTFSQLGAPIPPIAAPLQNQVTDLSTVTMN